VLKVPDDSPNFLNRSEWTTQRQAYHQRVESWARDRTERVRRGQKHPVYDFLFEYYNYRPSHLLRWSPGMGVVLEAEAAELDWANAYEQCPRGWSVSPHTFPESRIEVLHWTIHYLEQIECRDPYYGCFGAHEWAMVYREPNRRHGTVPLRLSLTETDRVVESASLTCTHYDAFRFFTPEAAPRNKWVLTRVASSEHDQPACLHTTLDLYKWAFLISPWIPAEVIADAFELARKAREIDMRASPYDLTKFGFEPIPIETRSGRDEYVQFQKEMVRDAGPIRRRIIDAYRCLTHAIECQKLARSTDLS
jgi:hypothetical protein